MQREVHGRLDRRGNHIAVAGVATIEEADDLWLWADGHEVVAKIRTEDHKTSIESLEVSGDVPYRSVGPEESRSGVISVEVGAAGTKLEGAKQPTFVDDKTHERYGLIGNVPEPGHLTLRGRVLQANMAYVARSSAAEFYVKLYAPIPRD